MGYPSNSFFWFVPNPIRGGFGRPGKGVLKVLFEIEVFHVPINEKHGCNSFLGESLEITGNADGPGHERALRIILRKFAQENDGDVLEQIFRAIEFRLEGIDVSGDQRLGFGPQASKLFLLVHTRGLPHSLYLPRPPNRYMKSRKEYTQRTRAARGSSISAVPNSNGNGLS